MFTGIIQEVGLLNNRIESGNKYQLIIGGTNILEGINRGDSIAVNGVCLTVVDYTGNSFTADLMPETLRTTNLNKLSTGSKVNLEQAVKADGFLGGHLVTGHVDGPGIVKHIKVENNARIVEIGVPKELTTYMVDKGSVALNGVSLTIIKVLNRSFTISLIPETWNFTNFNNIKVGDEINIETDLIGKYVFKMLNMDTSLKRDNSYIDKKFLLENGFL